MSDVTAETPTTDAPSKGVRERKPRAPRKDYGFSEDAVIRIVPDKVKTYRGHRKEWFESIKGFEGQTVKAWLEGCGRGGEKDPPRGWLRHFAQAGSVELVKPN